MTNPRSGAVLLEALVALTILAMLTASISGIMSQVASSSQRAHDELLQRERASDLLEAVALWPVEDLDRHLGRRPEGAFVLHVLRVRRSLYDVRIADSRDQRILVETTVYRREVATP